jgi:serine/threonine protein kinase
MVLSRVHATGVLHGDFRPLNVLYSPGGPILIDFSHSSADHVCPSGSPCPELESAKSQLNLTNSDIVNTRALNVVNFYALLRPLTAGIRIAKCHGMPRMIAGVVGAMAALSLINRVNFFSASVPS